MDPIFTKRSSKLNEDRNTEQLIGFVFVSSPDGIMYQLQLFKCNSSGSNLDLRVKQ